MNDGLHGNKKDKLINENKEEEEEEEEEKE